MKERASASENSATGSGGIVQTSPQMLVSSLGGGPAAEGQLPHGRS